MKYLLARVYVRLTRRWYYKTIDARVYVAREKYQRKHGK